MSTASVSIDRTALSMSALTISGDGTGTYSLTAKGLGRPAITARSTWFPDSPDVHGSRLRSAVKEQSSLPLEVVVQAASASALDAAVTALSDALWQFSFTTTVTVDGVSKVWTCSPASWAVASGVVEVSHAAAFLEVLTITIPVYPIPS